MRIFSYIIGVLLVYSTTTYGQSKSEFGARINFADTFHISEVNVTSKVSDKYHSGVHTVEFSPKQMRNLDGANLEQLISRYTPVYIKSDAGGLSTFRIRGTSSTQTAVLFGSLNINSLTLGQSNASNIPTSLFDDISLQLGASSAESGSGAIGGAVRLGVIELPSEGFQFKYNTLYGSFNEKLHSTKIKFRKGKFFGSTRFYIYDKDNNFTYNLRKKNFDTGKFYNETYTQNYAAIHNLGILQTLGYQFNSKNSLQTMVWLENDKHEAQPDVNQNLSTELSAHVLEDKNLRIWTEYLGNAEALSYKVAGGYVHDYTKDHNQNNQTIQTKRGVLEAEANKSFNTIGAIKFGAKYKYQQSFVYSYHSDTVEQHFELFSSLLLNATKDLNITLNLRQLWVTGFEVPFTPSLGAEYKVFRDNHTVVSLLGAASKSYRVPTFNNRFWPQDSTNTGNGTINPEYGENYELGFKATYCNDLGYLTLQNQWFYHDVNNWILWLRRGSYWKALNVQNVISKGTEVSLKAHADVNLWGKGLSIDGGSNFGLTITERVESKSTFDVLNRQLEYVPKYTENSWLSLNYRSWGLDFDQQYYSSRYYDQVSTGLDAYTLYNLSFSKLFKPQYGVIRVSVHLENIANTDYQNQFLYAMPGRSWKIRLSYNI